MLDRILYRNEWFDLPNQRLLEESFWSMKGKTKPIVGLDGKRLRANDYACDWKIESRKLWLLSATLEEDGSDILPRIVPGETSPLFAQWYSGHLYATGYPSRNGAKEIHNEHTHVPVIIFDIDSGAVYKTRHDKGLAQPGWQEENPSLPIRDDWRRYSE